MSFNINSSDGLPTYVPSCTLSKPVTLSPNSEGKVPIVNGQNDLVEVKCTRCDDRYRIICNNEWVNIGTNPLNLVTRNHVQCYVETSEPLTLTYAKVDDQTRDSMNGTNVVNDMVMGVCHFPPENRAIFNINNN